MLNKQGLDKIDWTDWTWNPISGCLHGCDYCYIKKMDERFNRNTMKPAVHGDRLNDLGFRKLKPGDKVFVGSSGDMFGNWVDPHHIQDVINIVRNKPEVTFQFLTKNPKRYQDFDFPQNCWLGITIDTQEREQEFEFPIDKDNLIFISFEPLLEGIFFHYWPYVNWVIMGANSNPGAKKSRCEWFESLMKSARFNRVPIFMKNNVPNPHWKNIKEFPE